MFNTRIQLRHHCPFTGKKKSFRISRTPGRKLSILYNKKRLNHIKCTDTKKNLNGIQRHSSSKFMSISKNKKKISRIYGGCLSGNSLRERIIKAFLIEEQKIVKRVLRNREKKN
jgi:large subunit ribosomal protein L34e